MPVGLRRRLNLKTGDVLEFDETAPYVKATRNFDRRAMMAVVGRGARKLKELEPDKDKPTPPERKKVVNELLDRAKKELGNMDELVIRRDGRNHSRLIRDLYSEDPDLKAEVERAREYLKGSPPEVH